MLESRLNNLPFNYTPKTMILVDTCAMETQQRLKRSVMKRPRQITTETVVAVGLKRMISLD
jgi:hypothetical protein